MYREAGMLRKNILISEPPASNSEPYLPYMWAVLKTHVERCTDLSSQFAWLEPIYLRGEAHAILDAYGDQPIDVLGVCSYVWNWELQCEIARAAKERNPDCLVVAGGPHPNYTDAAFFVNHPDIDLVVVKDGEITFSRILEQLMRSSPEFEGIGGVYIREPGSDRPICTGLPEVPKEFNHSPFVEQSEFFETLLKRHEPGHLNATWETNRGCPYSCSFCDWGSNTMSKLRLFDIDIVNAEADWLAKNKIKFVFLADANFGILPRDIQIADRINEAHGRHGHPLFLYYSPAKNNPNRAIEIAKLFKKTGVCATHTFAIQHTNDNVLAAVDRSNISTEKQINAIRSIMAENIPIDTQLILGIPGDTYDGWKSCLTDLMEWGLHDNYIVFSYCLLPNAPAARSDYQEKWEVETINCLLADTYMGRVMKNATEEYVRQRVIVGCRTFTQLDWVRMQTYTAFVQALHNCNVTRRISIYLRFSHGLHFRQFYDDIIENLSSRSSLMCWMKRYVESAFERMLVDSEATSFVSVHEIPRLPYLVDTSRWVFIQICMNLEQFFEELAGYLGERYSDAPNIVGVTNYQRNMILTPDYDRTRGKTFVVDADWLAYFDETGNPPDGTRLPEPHRMAKALVRVNDRYNGEAGFLRSELDWDRLGDEDRWMAWIEKTVLFRNSSRRNNHNDIRYIKTTTL